MSRQDADSTSELAKRAAFLSVKGWSQKEIATSLATSQASVSRLLSLARRRGWLITECNLGLVDSSRLERELFRDYRAVVENLRSQTPESSATLRDVTIVSISGTRPIDVGSQHQLLAFGRAIVPHIGEHLRKMTNVGVAWGKTVACVVSGLGQLTTSNMHRRRHVTFFPLCGEPMDYSVSRFSASASASRLHQMFNVDRREAISLGPIPARIPKQFSTKERAIIRRFIRNSESYSKVFSDADGLVKQMDTMITSGGTFASNSYDDLWLKDTARAEGLTPAKLTEITIGDIGGAFVARPGISTTSRRQLSAIADRWTGVTLAQIEKCANDAATKQAPGVVFVAIGSAKADIVVEAVRLGLINRLFMDVSLASAVLKKTAQSGNR